MNRGHGPGQVEGERHPCAKLRAAFVRRMRRSAATRGPSRFSFRWWLRAARRRVTRSALSNALHGATWRCEDRRAPPVPVTRTWLRVLRLCRDATRRRHPPPHGPQRYERPWRCRCWRCRAANAERQRLYQRRLRLMRRRAA